MLLSREVRVCPIVAPPRAERIKIPPSMDQPLEPKEAPHKACAVAPSIQSSTPDNVFSKARGGSRKKFFQSKRRCSSVSSTSSTDASMVMSDPVKTKGTSSTK